MLATEKKMLGVKETVGILAPFFLDCVNFWRREGKPDSEAKELALQDVERLNTNPYEPNGDWLHQDAKNLFIECIENL